MSDLPATWAEATLADVAKWGSGGTPKSTNAAYYGGDIPWAVIGDLTDEFVDRTAKSITQRGLDESTAKLVEPGTLMIAMYGSIGRLGIARIPMATNQAIATAVPKTRVIDPAYLFWYLRSQRARLVAAGKGATQDNIGQGVLKAWPIPLAPPAEQRRIVEAIEEQVSRLDAAGETLARCRGRLRQLRRGTISQLLDSAVTEQALGDVAEVTGGATPKGLKPISGGRIPFFKVGDMNTSEGRHMSVARLYLDDAAIATYRLKLWPAGTVVLPKRGIVKSCGTGSHDDHAASS